MVYYNFQYSVTSRSSFEYLAATTNKQTCCHLWYSSSCPSIVVSLTLTDAVECECQLSFELFSAWHVAQASLLRPCQLWGRISFVQLWRLGKSSTTFRCTLLQSSKDKEDFLSLLTPPQTFTDVKLWTGAEYLLSKNVSANNLIYSLFNFHFLWNFHFHQCGWERVQNILCLSETVKDGLKLFGNDLLSTSY